MATYELNPALRAALKTEFPSDFFNEEASEKAIYGKDWTKVFPPNPSGIAFPRTTDEVSRLLKLCSKHGVCTRDAAPAPTCLRWRRRRASERPASTR